jgi:hypothetical protein
MIHFLKIKPKKIAWGAALYATIQEGPNTPPSLCRTDHGSPPNPFSSTSVWGAALLAPIAWGSALYASKVLLLQS